MSSMAWTVLEMRGGRGRKKAKYTQIKYKKNTKGRFLRAASFFFCVYWLFFSFISPFVLCSGVWREGKVAWRKISCDKKVGGRSEWESILSSLNISCVPFKKNDRLCIKINFIDVFLLYSICVYFLWLPYHSPSHTHNNHPRGWKIYIVSSIGKIFMGKHEKEFLH